MNRCGYGSNIELFSYQSPDQQVVLPKNSDVGSYHIAFYVDDIKAADGRAAGQAIVYFKAPWACRWRPIAYPKGMAYEKGRRDDSLEPERPGE